MQELRAEVGRAVLAVVLWWTLPVAALGQEPADPPPDMLAKQRLNAVARAYKQLGAYADHGRLELVYSEGGVQRELKLPVPLRFIRSERMVWDATVTGVMADAEAVSHLNPQYACTPIIPLTAEDYLKPADPPVELRKRWMRGEADPDQLRLLGLGGPTVLEILATLMTHGDATNVIVRESRQVRSWPHQFHHEDGNWWVVEIQPKRQEPLVNIWIDPETDLVRWINIPLHPGEAEVGGLEGATLQWASWAIETDPDKVRQALEASSSRLLAQSTDMPPAFRASPPILVYLPPAEAAPPLPPWAISRAPVAQSKASPPSAPSTPEVPPQASGKPTDAIPYIAVSLIRAQGTPQTALTDGVKPSKPWWRALMCYLYRKDCN
jgi:hypothetical protein